MACSSSSPTPEIPNASSRLPNKKSDKDDDDDRLGEQIRKQSEEMLRMLKKR